MTDTNQLPPLPEPHCDAHEDAGFYYPAMFTGNQMRSYALQARAQVQGEPSWWMRETDEGAEWTDTAPLVLSGWTPLYPTPQPVQATQADVADDQILEIAEPFGEFQYGDAQGHKRIDFARAILALRPAAVPMTEDQVWNNDALMSANGIAGFKMGALMRIVRAVEAHHFGVIAKKEGA